MNTWKTAEAEQVHRAARAALLTRAGCGLDACRALSMSEFYTDHGELQTTVPEGVYEVLSDCARLQLLGHSRRMGQHADTAWKSL